MNAFVLIVLVLTASGPREVHVDMGGAGRACVALARDLNLQPPVFSDAQFVEARCVREYEA